MREIKFRAWDIIEKKFVDYGFSVDFEDGSIYDDNQVTMNDVELMQYTGLKDKNGKEIYEGDVVKIPDDYEEYGFMAGEQREVYYLDGCFRLKPKKENTRDRGNTIMDDMDKCEIIGNIYENPELLNPHTT